MSFSDDVDSFFNVIKKQTGDIACKAGIHGWGNWQYEKDNDCTKIRKCTRCGQVSTNKPVEHTPSNWKYAKDTGDCTMVKPCSRCQSALETKVEHIIGDWHYPVEKSCQNLRQCSRCAYFEERTLHTWRSWEYTQADSCKQRRTCERCPDSEHRTEHENWTDWAYSRPDSCEEQSHCERCRAERHRKGEHTWDSWHYAGPKTCDQLRFCVRCNRKEERPARNDDDHAGWSELVYSSPHSCQLFERHCLRCGAERSHVGLPQHHWTEWDVVSPTRRERKCRRCGQRAWESISRQR
jgi:hypothetical protein